MSDASYVLSAVRTPIGSLNGSLSSLPATMLGAVAISQAMERAGVGGEEVDEVLMGNVVSAGLGQNPARQASIHAGLPPSVPAVTINKVCGSGLKTVALADQSIRLGESKLAVAGGMESMSRAPHLLPQARRGYRMGNGELIDAMIHDGLWDAYGDQHMGVFGDRCAAKYRFSRSEQDDFAVRSYERARAAAAAGVFSREIVPLTIIERKREMLVELDEEPGRFDEAKLRELRPAFDSDGSVTAGNASTINDGAAALVIASAAECEASNRQPLARIVGSATFSQEPEWFTTAPIGAIKALLQRLRWTVDEVDLFEINEAFSCVAMAAAHDLGIADDRLNIYGGAVSLGHPIGCSGARILVTLLNALRTTGGRRGIACLCIGGGEAIALAVESTTP